LQTIAFSDEISIGVLLHGLPAMYQGIIYAWDAVEKSWKLADVVSKL
jgi:hypothetical protein